MATGTIKKDNVLTIGNLTIATATDFPLIFKETGTDDTKGLIVTDKNDTLRYRLAFSAGHLYFASFDSSGNTIIATTQII